jgi:hypothetical protein
MLRPALVIALGGTGTNIVLRLRERFHMMYGTPDPEGVRYIFVDTDTKNNLSRRELQGYAGRTIGIAVGPNTLNDLQIPNSPTSQRLRLDDWFDPDLRGRLTNQSFQAGVGGVRMYGRLVLLAADQLRQLTELISNDIQALRRNAAGNDPGSLHIFVASSSGGGTGSGSFIDMGYLTRLILQDLAVPGGVCEREGLLAIAVPTLVPAPQQARNSAAMLSEMDYFCEPGNIFQAVYIDRPLPESIGREAPYDYILLSSPTQGDQVLSENPVQAMGLLESKMADYIFIRLTEPGRLGGLLRDVRTNWQTTPRDNRGYPNRFMTFGVSIRQFPVGLVEMLGYRYAIRNFTWGWLKRPREGDSILDDSELATRPDIQQAYTNDLAALRKLIGLPSVHEQTGKQPRDAVNDALYAELIQTQQEALEASLRSRANDGKVDDLFQYSGADQPVAPGSPGYVAGTISRNATRLMNPNEPASLFNRIRDYLYAAAFDRTRGPRYAQRLARDLVEEMRREEEFMDEVLRAAGMVGTGGTGGGGLNRAQKVRRDFLLLFWADTAAKRERGGSGGGASGPYANRRFETSLLESKKFIYGTLRDKLLVGGENLEGRFKRLSAYIEAWANQAEMSAADNEKLVENLPYGTIYPKDRIEEKWKNLTPTVSQDSLEPLQRQTRSQQFGVDMPKDPRGAPDFAPFENIGEQIRAALRSEAGESASSIYGESVLRLIAEINEGNLEPTCQQMASESRPLLNLRLDAPGYAELLNSRTSFGQPTYLWFAMASPEADFNSYQAFWTSTLRAAQGITPVVRANPDAPIRDDLKIKNGSIAALIFVRAAFPSRIINQYEQDDRWGLLFPPNATTITTPFTQTGILLPPPLAVLDEARVLLMLGETLRVMPNDPNEFATEPKITWGGAEHTFEYQLGPYEVERMRYPKNDFERAAYLLAVNEKALSALRKALNLRAGDMNQRGIIAEKIVQEIHKLNDRILNAPGGAMQGYYDSLDLGGIKYPESRKMLFEGAKKLGIDLFIIDPSLHPWAKPSDADSLWRCNKCNYVLGAEVPDMQGECPNCGHPNR